MTLFPSRCSRLLAAFLTLACMGASRIGAAEAADTTPAPSSSKWNFMEILDRLPDTIGDRLPSDRPSGAVHLHVRPRFGDLLHRDYLRVPTGAQLKVTDDLETSAEVEGYFTHGLAGSAGYGFSTLRLGSKCEHALPWLDQDRASIGFNFQSPLGRPPQSLTDGLRHFQPYVSAAHPLSIDSRILGYASFGGDFLQHTAIPPAFGRNQLHANSLGLSVGAARDWPRFHAALTANVASTALTSDEGRQVFSLYPEVTFPLRGDHARTQILFTLSGHAVWGPDGTDTGVSSSVRLEFEINGRRRSL